MPRTDWSLYLVTDTAMAERRSGRTVADVVRGALRGGVTVVQVRDKDLGDREFADLARTVQGVIAEHAAQGGGTVPLFVNDRVELAVELGCHVHVGQHDAPARSVRDRIGPTRMVGLSVSTAAEIAEAERDGAADVLGIGPVWPTATKTDGAPALGIDGLRALARNLRLPSVAIGGVSAENIGALIGTGVDGACVVSAICAAADPEAAARALCEAQHRTLREAQDRTLREAQHRTLREAQDGMRG